MTSKREGAGRPLPDETGAAGRIAELEAERARLAEELARARRALKEHEARLARLGEVEAVGRLAGSVAHSLNNLLTALACDAELALSRLPAGDPVRRHVASVGRAIERGGALVRQLLAFGRERTSRPRTVRPGELLAELADLMRRLLGERIELTLDVARRLPAVALPQFEQVLLTLLANARDAMPGGGRLSVKASAARDLPGGGIELIVADTGEGMDAEARARLFDPLFSTKGEGGGDPALGLAWVHGVVEQAGGRIEVASRPGEGATFRLLLPAAREADSRERAGARPAEAAETGAAETLLLVEDEENVRSPMAELLEDRGYLVLSAADGAEAARIAERHRGPIHLLVTDVILPGMSGQEVAALLTERRPEVKVLYTTGYPDELVGGSMLPGGRPASLLRKPFTGQALVAMIREMLAQGS